MSQRALESPKSTQSLGTVQYSAFTASHLDGLPPAELSVYNRNIRIQKQPPLVLGAEPNMAFSEWPNSFSRRQQALTNSLTCA